MDQGKFSIVVDGDLGGCGYGERGDPRTWLPDVWDELLFLTEAESVLDLGCGFGYSTKWFWDSGLEVVGLEGSKKICDQAISICVRYHDFTEGKASDLGSFDLCWCSEFLEHISDEYEPCYFDALTKCRYVALSAATPGQGGHHHVNERTCEYWIEKFGEYGFEYCVEESRQLRAIALNVNPESYFARNGLFFRRVQVVPTKELWTDTPGSLSVVEGNFLRGLAGGKWVLHLGERGGRMSKCLSEVAKDVEEFGLGSSDRRFDLVVVETNVEENTILALDVLFPGGKIVWCGWDREEVRNAVEKSGLPLESVKYFKGLGLLETARYQVMVVMPHCGDAEMRSVKSAMRGAIGRYADQVGFLDFSYGCLTHNFNMLLSYCLGMRDQGRVTHMAMLHSDVWSDVGWVDVLAEEMCRTRATVVSAVVTIKDPDDDRTSTAIGEEDDPWRVKRFIRLNEEGNMPETFGEDDVCENESEVLLVNTGCMLIDLSDDFWDSFAFKIYNRIVKDESGVRCPQFRPEDWEMSRELHAASRPYVATWKVKTRHIGVDEWENRYEDSPILDCG